MDRLWTRLDRFGEHRMAYFSIESVDRLDRLDTFFSHTHMNRSLRRRNGKTLSTGPTGPNRSTDGTAQ